MPLSLLYCGATGQTAVSLQNTLKLGNASQTLVAKEFHTFLGPFEHDSSIRLANAIFLRPDYHIQRDYAKLARHKFYATVTHLNFANPTKAALEINSLIKRKTNGTIKNVIISPATLKKDTILLVVNSIHINETWLHQFNKLDVSSLSIFFPNGCRFSSSSDIKKSEMMHITVYLLMDSWVFFF